MCIVSVVLVFPYVGQAFANDVVVNAASDLDGSWDKLVPELTRNLHERAFDTASHCHAGLDGATLQKQGPGTGSMIHAPAKWPCVPHMAHQAPSAQRMNLRLYLRASAAKNEHSQHSPSEETKARWGFRRRAALMGLTAGILGTPACSCQAANAFFTEALKMQQGAQAADKDLMLASKAQELTRMGLLDVPRRLQRARKQIGHVKMLVEDRKFRRAQEEIQVIESDELRADVAVAGSLLRSERPDFKVFDLAAVIDPLDGAEFALNRAERRANNLQSQTGLTTSMTRADDVLFNLNQIQDGIDNILEALKCQCPRDRASLANLADFDSK
jgi:hypothetical protein